MPNIHHEILIGASIEEVYTAIANENGLSAWWAPGTNAVAELNSIARFPFGDNYFKEMKITTLQPFEVVKWNCISGADEWIGTTISFTLLHSDKEILTNAHPEIKGQAEQLQHSKGTLLIFHHDNWKAYSPMFAECNYTWAQFLRSLKLLCETGKGAPWPNQHRTQY